MALDTPKSQTIDIEESSRDNSLSERKEKGKNELHLVENVDKKDHWYTKKETKYIGKNTERIADDLTTTKYQEITSGKEQASYNYFCVQ
jgi:hypothetical protein